jgi:hypothetical protein
VSPVEPPLADRGLGAFGVYLIRKVIVVVLQQQGTKK